MTETQTQALQLVRVNVSHYDDGSASHGMLATRATDDDRTFFAVDSVDMGPTWVTLVVPESDPRSAGMWSILTGDSRYSLPQDGQSYRGWNIRREDVTVLDAPAETETAGAERFVPPTDNPTDSGVESNSTDPDGLVPGAWFTWGTGEFYYRVQSVEDGRVQSDAYLPRAAVDAGDFSDWQSTSYSTSVEHLKGVRLRVHSVQSAPAAESTETPEAPAEVTFAYTAADLERARLEGRQAAEETFQEWKDAATRTAHQYAEDNSLCGEFDRCMEAIGLPTRADVKHSEVSVELRIDGLTLPRDFSLEDVVEAIQRLNSDRFAYSDDTDGLVTMARRTGMVYVRDEDGEELASW